ncbi:glutamate--tRNA ligase family protein, partial [Flavobacterium sp.]|uniref:glutamate--tRNA ligase n=1 Tax=Flavobacterium sp. TaxID=239 RepID=UPI002C8CC784
IRGDINFETNLLDDKVLFKSDGMPTYHLANIVDDHLMETSHVIRGEEWLPSLPLHSLLYKAFGWQAPQFAHLPLILKPIGNGKLSKRDGDKMGFPVFPLDWKNEDGTISSGYREKGFFPEAVVNFLALLGWNDGTEQELFSLEELCEKFDLNRVHKAGAKFDPEKNKWFNHQYLQKQSDESLAEAFEKILIKRNVKFNNSFYAYRLVKEIHFKIQKGFELKGKIEKPFLSKSFKSNYLLSLEHTKYDSIIDNKDIKNEFNGMIEEYIKLNPSLSSIIDSQYYVCREKLNVKNNEIDIEELTKIHPEFNYLRTSKSYYLLTNKLIEIVKLIKERANFVSEFWELSDYFFVAPTSYDEKAAKNWKEETPSLMKQVSEVLNSIDDFTSVNIETILKNWMTENEIGMGKVMQPLRLSLVGALKGPHLF